MSFINPLFFVVVFNSRLMKQNCWNYFYFFFASNITRQNDIQKYCINIKKILKTQKAAFGTKLVLQHFCHAYLQHCCSFATWT
jgi:hypothetical protein